MKLSIHSGYPINGVITVPGDKSISHRAALFSSMAIGESRIDNFLYAGVTRVMLEALTDLGISWQLDGKILYIHGIGLDNFNEPEAIINCGNSATTLRLLTGALTAGNILAVLDGSISLRRRPMNRIIEPLTRMGAIIKSAHGCAPLFLKKRHQTLTGIQYLMPVASAQLKSCLILAGLAADSPTTLWESAHSRDHTERMLNSMGVNIDCKVVELSGENYFQIQLFPETKKALLPLHVFLPGDISSAAFFIVAALITPNSELILQDVGLNPTRTGLLDALNLMGADIDVNIKNHQAGEPIGEIIVRHSEMTGINVKGELVVRMIDEFPIFAIAAACAKGPTTVTHAEELRYKESDRISAICESLSCLGVPIIEKSDGFIIQGGCGIQGGFVNSYADHRLALSLTIAGLASHSGVVIEGAEIIDESYPGFITTLQSCGAMINIERNV